MSRDPLAVLRNQAGIHATAAHARGDETERRRWLDVLILLDQHDEDCERASQPTESDEETTNE